MKILLLLMVVFSVCGVPQGTLKPKKYSRTQLKEHIAHYHSTIPKDSFRVQQATLNNDRHFFSCTVDLLDQSKNNPIEGASLEHLEQHLEALKNYQQAINQAEQLVLKAGHSLEQSPLSRYTVIQQTK